MEYKVIERTCDCSGRDVNLVLRTINKQEIEKYKDIGMNVASEQAVMACPECGGTVISWLFLNRDVKTAVWALKERYCLEPIEQNNKEELK